MIPPAERSNLPLSARLPGAPSAENRGLRANDGNALSAFHEPAVGPARPAFRRLAGARHAAPSCGRRGAVSGRRSGRRLLPGGRGPAQGQHRIGHRRRAHPRHSRARRHRRRPVDHRRQAALGHGDRAARLQAALRQPHRLSRPSPTRSRKSTNICSKCWPARLRDTDADRGGGKLPAAQGAGGARAARSRPCLRQQCRRQRAWSSARR